MRFTYTNTSRIEHLESRTLLSAAAPTLAAAPGSLDTTFGAGGILLLPNGKDLGTAYRIAVDPATQNVVVAGNSGACSGDSGFLELQRYRHDGTLDPTFGSGGTVVNKNLGTPAQVVIESGAKVVVRFSPLDASNNAQFLVRFNADGSLDPTFGAHGLLPASTDVVHVNAMTLLAGDKLLLTATHFQLTTYGTTGVGEVIRLNADGSLDKSFGGGDGVVESPEGPADFMSYGTIAVDPNGRIVVAGVSSAGTRILDRFAPDGTPDLTFCRTVPYTPAAERILDMVAKSDGSVALVGTTYYVSQTNGVVGFVHYTNTGQPDTTFGAGGLVKVSTANFEVDAGAIRPDGRVILGGGKVVLNNGIVTSDCDFTTVARFNANGSIDTTFGSAGYAVPIGLTVSVPQIEHAVGDLALAADGKILLVNAGATNGGDFAPTRLTAAGALDPTFGYQGTAGVRPTFDSGAMRALPNGKTVMAGVVRVGARQGIYIRRFGADGSLDTSFGVAAGFAGADGYGFAPIRGGVGVVCVRQDRAGKFLVLVGRSAYDALGSSLVRFNADGSLDTTFGSGGIAALPGAPLGYGIVNGDFTVDAQRRIVAVVYKQVVRLTASGKLDASFGTGGIADQLPAPVDVIAGAAGVAVQPDGRVLIGVGATDYSMFTPEDSFIGVARYTATGHLDPTFGNKGIASVQAPAPLNGARPSRVARLANGNILVVGHGLMFGKPNAGFPVCLMAAEFLPTGKPVSTFGTGGLVTTQTVDPCNYWISDLMIQPDDKFLVAGEYDPPESLGDNGQSIFHSFVARFTATGQPDTAFSPVGGLIIKTDVIAGAANARFTLLPGGDVEMAGSVDGQAAVARFIAYKPAASGSVFNDVIGSGHRDPGDTPVAGQTVYADLNNNSRRDAGEPTATTDAAGKFNLVGLPAGEVILRLVLKAGQRQSYPAGGSGYHVLVDGSKIENVNFLVTDRAYVSGTIFNDTNGNSRFDAGESPLSNWQVYLDINGDGMHESGEPTRLTDATGRWWFDRIPPGTFTLRVAAPDGWQSTDPGQAVRLLKLAPGQVVQRLMLGFRSPTNV